MDAIETIDDFKRNVIDFTPQTIDITQLGLDSKKREHYSRYQNYFTAANITGGTAGIGALVVTFPGLYVALIFGMTGCLSFHSFMKLALISYGTCGVIGLAAGGLWLEGDRRKRFVEKKLPQTTLDCRRRNLTSMLRYDPEKVTRQGLLGKHAVESFAKAGPAWKAVQEAKQRDLDAIDAAKSGPINDLRKGHQHDPASLKPLQEAIMKAADLAKVEAAEYWDAASDWLKNWYAEQVYTSYLTENTDGGREPRTSFKRELT
jgi:hypothetical protein